MKGRMSTGSLSGFNGFRFTPYPAKALTEAGSGPNGVLHFAGRLYDNVTTHRRGVTSLSHPKPKLTFTFAAKVSSLCW